MERKIAASLNDIYEDDAYILKHLPEKGVSEIIKAALVLYYRVQNEEVILTSDIAASAPDEPAITPIMEALLAGLATLIEKSDVNTRAIVEAIQTIQVSIPAMMPANGSNGHHSASDGDRESIDDPLVRNMISMNFDAFSDD